MQQLEVIINKTSNNKFNNAFWTKKKALKDAILQSVFVACKQQKIKHITEYPIQLTFVFYFKGRLLDLDNTGNLIKSLIDGLRYAKILDDDSTKFVNQLTIRSEKSKRAYDYVLIEID